MKIKKIFSLVLASCMAVLMILPATAQAQESLFTPGAGYDPGLYDIEAMQPAATSTDRNSRFAGVTSNPYIKWKFNRPNGGYSDIVLDRAGTVYLTTHTLFDGPGGTYREYIYAINPDGTQKWRTFYPNLQGSPVIDENQDVIIPNDAGIYKLHYEDTDDGPSLSGNWVRPDIDGTTISGQVAMDSEGTMYFHTSQAVVALQKNGFIKWSKSYNDNLHNRGNLALSKDGSLYFKLTYNHGGSLICYDANTGAIKWTYPMGGDATYSAPAIAEDGTVYVVDSDNHNVLALNPDGTLKWKKSDAAVQAIDPIVGLDGTVYYKSNTGFNALNPDGTLKWSFKETGKMNSTPIIDKFGDIFFNSDANFYSISSQGTLNWKLTLDNGTFQSPAIAADGTIYTTSGGNVYAIGGNVKTSTDLPAPAISSLSLNYGELTGNNVIAINGENFVDGAQVQIGGVQADTTFNSDKQLMVKVPAGKSTGMVDVFIINPDGQFAVLPNGYTYMSINPNSGVLAGGNGITIHGENFVNGTKVLIGGVQADTIFYSSKELKVKVPAGSSAGMVDVTIINPDGQELVLSNGYTYEQPAPAPAPVITIISPDSGALAGGNVITIYGENFVSGTKVEIGGVQADTTFWSNKELRVRVPAGNRAGVVDVTVINPDGGSTQINEGYTYN